MKLLILSIMAVASVSFSLGKDFGERQRESIQQETATTIDSVPVTYLDDSFIFENSIVEVASPKRYRESVKSTTTSTTTTTIALPDGDCSEWYPVALDAGWSIDQLEKLGVILWRESNCRNDVANKTYSYGLTQIEWSAHHSWLESEFGITEREELYDPYINLMVAKWLFDYAEDTYSCGWQPWYPSVPNYQEWC